MNSTINTAENHCYRCNAVLIEDSVLNQIDRYGNALCPDCCDCHQCSETEEPYFDYSDRD